MRHSIYFVNSSNIYFETGLESRKQAKSKLEMIARAFNNSGEANGKITSNNDFLEKSTSYQVSYKSGIPYFKRLSFKKIFYKV